MGRARSTREDRLHLAACIAATAAVALVYWWPAHAVTEGDWPIPLDDTYIHFDFARSIALGHPFEWLPGNGYSSGETAPLWALVLAPGWLAGMRGTALGAWAGLVACACVAGTMRLARSLARGPRVPAWAGWLASALLLGVGMLDWLWFSGMETPLVALALLGMVAAVRRAGEVDAARRPRTQWWAGLLGAALVLCRPEAALVVATLAVVAAREGRSRAALGSLVRVAGPAALATLGAMGLNLAMTGDAAAAGARLKLLSSNPWLSDVDRAQQLVLNVLELWWKVIQGSMTAVPALWWVLPALGACGLVRARTRGLAAGVLAGAVLFALLVSWNGAARYQNFRYYMPAVVALFAACAVGLRALCNTRPGRVAGAGLALAGLALACARVPAQVRYFRDCCENIHHQHARIARALSELGAGRVLVGDAGAIPYLSGRPAIDALGLGGYRRMPWVRAATEGEGATLELLQSLPAAERPTHLALYPNWFGETTRRFGREVHRETLENNVICGGTVKAIYVADWRAFDGDVAPAGATDELDVADVVSERAHAYGSPAPDGGWPKVEVLGGVFDAGRALVPGHAEAFTAHAAGRSLAVRTNGGAIDVDVSIAQRHTRLVDSLPHKDQWTTERVEIEISEGDRVTITPRLPFTDFHVWVVE